SPTLALAPELGATGAGSAESVVLGNELMMDAAPVVELSGRSGGATLLAERANNNAPPSAAATPATMSQRRRGCGSNSMAIEIESSWFVGRGVEIVTSSIAAGGMLPPEGDVVEMLGRDDGGGMLPRDGGPGGMLPRPDGGTLGRSPFPTNPRTVS